MPAFLGFYKKFVEKYGIVVRWVEHAGAEN